MLFNTSIGIFLDFYELTMAQVYFEKNLFGKATFSLSIRTRPKNRPFFFCRFRALFKTS
jgi:nicotinate phosphoribosyltransferase